MEKKKYLFATAEPNTKVYSSFAVRLVNKTDLDFNGKIIKYNRKMMKGSNEAELIFDLSEKRYLKLSYNESTGVVGNLTIHSSLVDGKLFDVNLIRK